MKGGFIANKGSIAIIPILCHHLFVAALDRRNPSALTRTPTQGVTTAFQFGEMEDPVAIRHRRLTCYQPKPATSWPPPYSQV